MKAAGRRASRVEKELQHIVASFLLHGFPEKLYGLVSVSRVEAGEKIRTAKVYISVLGSEEDREMTMQALIENLRSIQNEVNRNLRMKFVPRVSVALDRGFEHMAHIQSLLHKVNARNEEE